jgi:hypothetical protein
MPLQKHTVFVGLTKNHRDSTMAPVTDAETVLDDEGNAPTVRGRGKPLENGQRMAILQALLCHSKNSKLDHGAVGLVAKQFKVSRVTVSSIWKRGRESVAEDGGGAMVVSHRKKNCGRKLKDYSQQLANLSSIPLNERTCYRSTSASTGIPMTRLHSMVKKGGIRRHSSAVKPVLTDANKQFRIQYAINNINMDRRLFDTMMDVVHVDEKWFDMKQVNKTYFLAPGEPDPYRAAKSKRYIEKVMFLAAVARPRFDTTRNSHFDGKLGIFPFTTMVPAQRSSRNRPAGTLEMKPMSVTKEVYRDFICNKVIPAIQQKWPLCHRSVAIKIQQDNAKPHLIRNDDPQLQAAVAATGMNITLINQPPNSPDTNVLDLGYFNAIQSLQQKKHTNTIPELVKAVEDSFVELDRHTLNKVFLTHQQVLEQIILCGGGNNYKLPHMGKERLLRQGQLPVSIGVSDELHARIQQLQQPQPQEEEAHEA